MAIKMRPMRFLPKFLALVFIPLSVTAFSAESDDVNDLKAKAEKGDASAQNTLGIMYDLGVNIAPDKAEAAKWFLKAAEQGNASAQNAIGSLYQAGNGVPHDDAAAAGWYEKAAAQGHATALSNLGYMYDLGKGVAQDRAKAIGLYRQAAEKGSLNAMVNLGISYQQGLGATRDLAEAFMWLDLARFYALHTGDRNATWRARGLLDELRQEMSRAELKEGRRRAKEWDKAHRPERIY